MVLPQTVLAMSFFSYREGAKDAKNRGGCFLFASFAPSR